MIIFLYGPDAYRLKQAKEEIINRYKAKYRSGVNFFDFDMSEIQNSGPLEDALRNFSFFNEHKLIICRNSFQNKSTSELLKKMLSENKAADIENVTVMVTADITDKELTSKYKELFNILSNKKNVVKKIEPLADSRLAEWVKKEFAIRNCSIKADGLKRLLELAGTDTWKLINEIDKLAAYKHGTEITLADTSIIAPEKIENNIFNFIDAFCSGKRGEALVLLYKELHTDSDPYQILGAITYQVRNMLIVKDLASQGLSAYEISKKAAIHPFVVKKITAGLSKFSLDKLKLIHKKIIDIEIASKTGKTNINDSLYNFITL